jgi:hypothetical protein
MRVETAPSVTVLRTLQQPNPVGKTAPFAAPIISAGAVLGTDQLRLSTPRPVGTQPIKFAASAATSVAEPQQVAEKVAVKPTAQPLGAKVVPSRPSLSQSGLKTWEDYETVFKWVEEVTGKPIAYQTPESQHAYIQAIQGKPQEYYDPKGFLASLGVTGAMTYGRDDKGVHKLISTIDYTPNSTNVSKPLQVFQKFAFWFFKHFPKSFDWIANKADNLYFVKKDMKAKTWINTPVPQPPIALKDPLIPKELLKQVYGNTQTIKSLNAGWSISTASLFDKHFLNAPESELSSLFEDDFHMGIPSGDHDAGEQHYGTFAIAKQLGFSDEQARRIGTADFDMDLNNTAYGNSDAFPDGIPSKHFDLNKDKPGEEDTRFIWAQRHLDAAVELAKRGHFEQAEKELGYGLHGIQDAFAHGHIRIASHAVTGEIPDAVKYNPVAAYEATLATIGYMHTYLTRVMA